MSSPPVNIIPPSSAATADSGDSSVYISVGDNKATYNIRTIKEHEKIYVRTADETIIKPYIISTLKLQHIKAITVHFFHGLSSSLVSIGHIIDMIDGNGAAVFNRKSMQIYCKSNGKIIVKGERCAKPSFTSSICSPLLVLKVKDNPPLTFVHVQRHTQFQCILLKLSLRTGTRPWAAQ
jgi:hypothetical protein